MSDENEPDITPDNDEDANALAETEDEEESMEEALEAEVRRGGGNPFGGGMPPQPDEVTKSFAIELPRPERHPLDTPGDEEVPSAESAQLNMQITSTRDSLDLRVGVTGEADELTHSQYEAYKKFVQAVLAN